MPAQCAAHLYNAARYNVYAPDRQPVARAEISMAQSRHPMEPLARRPGGIRAHVARPGSSRANARAGLVSDAAISLALLAVGIERYSPQPRAALVAIATGLLTFSFVEYAFHRWLFHGGFGALGAGHHRHHEQPTGYDALPFFLPPLLMLALAASLRLVVSHGTSLLLAGAVAAGYATYGLVHTVIHRRRFRQPLLARWAALHHMHHRHPQHNFGVTTPLWDILLGTRYVRARVAAARRARG